MRKILKSIGIVILAICAFVLLGCANSKVTYTDPETGEEKEISIEKTDSDQEVTDSLYALALSETPIKVINKETMTYSFNIKLKVRDNKEEEFDNLELEGKLVLASEVNYNPDFTTIYDVYKMISFSGKFEIKGKVPTDNGKSESFSKSTVEIYLEDGVIYLKSDIDSKLVSFISDNYEDIDSFNNKTIKYDLKNPAILTELSKEEKEAIASVIEDGNSKSIRDLLEDGNMPLKDIRAELEEAVRLYNVKISRVSGSDVTYSFDLSGASSSIKNSVVTAKVTVDVSEMALSGAAFDATFDEENLKGTASLELDISYKASVAKISAKDKEEAVSFDPTLNE